MSTEAKMQAQVEALADWLVERPKAWQARQIIALAGPPAVGKSTLADALVKALAARCPKTSDGSQKTATLVPMDGFHLDNAILDARGLRAVKGREDSFDAWGLWRLLQAIRCEPQRCHYAPRFDRVRDLSIAGALAITPEDHWVVVEGNYLLLDAPDWRPLHPLFDVRILLGADLAVLEQRLMQRWLDLGFSAAEAEAKAQGNDLINAKRVLAHSVTPDRYVETDGEA